MNNLSKHALADLDLDEASRPVMPPLDGATDMHRRKGKHLAAIHRHHLTEVARVAAVLERIRLGDAAPAELQQIVLSTKMHENFAAAGTLCGHGCRVLQMHHDIEEAHMFPGLAAASVPALTLVVDKLKSEHLVIHELLDRLRNAAEDLTQEPTEANFVSADETFQVLKSAILSHFRYEESELEEAIGLFLDHV